MLHHRIIRILFVVAHAMLLFFLFFFFQAEDGIRDLTVTGVQTCALPISSSGRYVSRLTGGTLAIIMAGGRGERLRDLTAHRCKPATPFGGKFRIIDFVLSNCVNSGIRQISILTQYKAQSLIQHVQHGWSYLRGEFSEVVEVVPAQQQLGPLWYRGTADAVHQNIELIVSHRPKHVLVLAGDRSEEHTSELQSQSNLVCRLLLAKKKND